MLSDRYRAHREYYRHLIIAQEEWSRLPWPVRIENPEPPLVPDLIITDQQGCDWIIDDQLILILEDKTVRLQKWMDFGEKKGND